MWTFNTVSAKKLPVCYKKFASLHGVNINIEMSIDAAKDSTSFVVPFSKVGNLILLKAKVDTTEGNFILDSGCPGLVLNLTYFRNYARIEEPGEEKAGITGTVSGVGHTIVDHVEFGKLKVKNLAADIVNLGHLENTRGVKILGLIGLYFLENTEMIIDYEKHLIYFHVISKVEAKTYNHVMLTDTTKYNTIPFEIADKKIIIIAQLANKKLKLIIDCAAETNLLDSRLPNRVFENLNITERIMLTGIGNVKIEAIKAEFKNFKIGNRNVETLPFVITNLQGTCLSYNNCIDGILGFDFLALQKIGFNFVTRKMYLWK